MKHSFFTLFSLVFTPLFSQSLDKYDSLIFDEEINCVCVNVRQEIFTGMSSGVILKFSSEGEKLEEFSYPNLGKVSRIDCANPLKVFVFFEDTQRYLFIDRFSANPTIYEVPFESYKRADYLSLAADQSLWSVTTPDIAMSRHVRNTTQELYLLSALLEPNEEIQNLLPMGSTMMLQTSDKLYFFNLAGQLIEERPMPIAKITVARNNGYFIDQNALQLRSVIDNQDLNSESIPSGYLSGILLSEDELMLIKKQELHFYLIR